MHLSSIRGIDVDESSCVGRPKAIVHRAGGMLIQSKKELAICADLKPEDVFFYYTTTYVRVPLLYPVNPTLTDIHPFRSPNPSCSASGWMMWNFLVGALSSACTLVLYDGSPLKDPSYLWKLVDKLEITIFGTSAKYLDGLAVRPLFFVSLISPQLTAPWMQKAPYHPGDHHSLGTLKQIHSTGSPLAPAQFDFVYEKIKKDVVLASITGGTDICSLFAGTLFTSVLLYTLPPTKLLPIPIPSSARDRANCIHTSRNKHLPPRLPWRDPMPHARHGHLRLLAPRHPSPSRRTRRTGL